MRNLGRIIFVTAVLAGLFALMKYLAYGVNEQFGYGFLAGAGLMTPILILAGYLSEQEGRAKGRAEIMAELLSRESVRDL